ncbi:non-ribosomal peptide synthetase [Lysobacter sp. cf310]|uniref:non-ribosomal peptide synthetase n=1 Tax=Lysobacter sp. cf310 TaxID=1761790 RepID=UPI0008ED3FA3|nr:non-ribosomal peptide synthetase [Lysobacter sp. cf310]SFL14046.1 amino acid adenylation domain-containing protein/thioester reductase domain-containing protein [Lysobacter sp. cf310]
MSRTDDNAPGAMAERLARLTPQQRELLRRRLSAHDAETPQDNAIQRRSRPGESLPLSAAQQRIWFFERLQPGSGAYHVYGHHLLRGALDPVALERALADVIQRHDGLRMSFAEVAGEPRQTVAAQVEVAVPLIDLRGLDPVAREAAARQYADEETESPFDLARAPLVRASLLRLDEEEHLLLLVMHHIVSDAWSAGVLFDELSRCYDARLDGQTPALPELRLQFGDAVLWQREAAQERQVADQLEFWRQALDGSSGLLDLPGDRPRSPTPTGRGARHHLRIPLSVAAGLADLARREHATLFMALLAALQTLLGRHAGQDDVVIGSPVANRGVDGVAPLIGLFVNTLALRGDLSGDPSFRELLARTRAHCLDAFEHAQAPLERVIDQLRLERVPGRTPLFQTMFVLQNAGTAPLTLRGLNIEWFEPDVHTSRFELTLSLGASEAGLDGVLDYDSDLFDASTIARLADQYGVLLHRVLADPDLPLSRLSLLDQDARHEVLALGDGGPAPQPPAPTLYGLFERQAQRSPEAIAIVEPGRELSYRDVYRRANGIAQRLRALGTVAETRVAVLADRSAEALIGVLGVLAAGGAYVPIDPAHPDERIAFLLADAGALALVAPAALVARADAVAGTVPCVITDGVPPAEQPPADLAGADSAAYVIYTSGSTGAPKGVVIEHRGVVNLTLGFMARHDFVAQRLLMIPPLVFDASVGDIFPALASGSALVLHPAPAELGPYELESFCRDYGVTAIDAPAALWRRWSEGWFAAQRTRPLLPALRLMMIGGESVPLEQVRRYAGVSGGRVALCNHYGPTEASVCATMLSTRDGGEFAGAELPIGTPLPGVRVYVLDAELGLAPRGVIGELCIGGAGIARGYLGQPALSEAAFLPDPYAETPGARLYRTGDLARWNTDGSLQFLGRRDHQVKLRGVRIELGEIETALAAHPQVQAAAAALREDRPGDKRLVAYVVADAGLEPAALREFLAQRLPEALLPSLFVTLPALPLNRNGKVDRHALPVPPAAAAAERRVRAAQGEVETGVLAVWRQVLGREDIGADEDFFALGGDSLSTLPLVFKLHAAFGVELPLAAVFASPTVAGLARAIEAQRAGVADARTDLRARVVLPPDIDPSGALAPAARAQPASALITGATGFLGAYLVRELLDTTGAELLCLVRADNETEGLRRIRANLDTYELWRAGDEQRLVPVCGDLSAPRLGLSAEAFDALAQRAEVIFHNGGQVNFLAPYEHLEAANVGGTLEVLRLAARHRVKPVHLVSTLGVYLTERHLDRVVCESDPPPDAEGQMGGYNQSKWVGEQLGLAARERGLPVAIYRPARITGDSRLGTSNLGDYFNAWIKGCVQLGYAPHLPDESFDMAPVDYVGRAIVRLALGAGEANGQYHFFNPRRLPIVDAVETMRDAGLAVEEIDYPSWRKALLAEAAVSRENALAPFAGLFPQDPDPREPRFDCSATLDAVAALGLVCPPADRVLFATYLDFLRSRGALPLAVEEEEA